MKEQTEIVIDGDDARIYALIGNLRDSDSESHIIDLISSEQWKVIVADIQETITSIANRAYRLGIERGKREAYYDKHN